MFIKDENPAIPAFDDIIPPDQGLHNIIITLRDVELKMKSLKENSAPGPDDIHPKVLKRCYKSLAKPV